MQSSANQFYNTQAVTCNHSLRSINSADLVIPLIQSQYILSLLHQLESRVTCVFLRLSNILLRFQHFVSSLVFHAHPTVQTTRFDSRCASLPNLLILLRSWHIPL